MVPLLNVSVFHWASLSASLWPNHYSTQINCQPKTRFSPIGILNNNLHDVWKTLAFNAPTSCLGALENSLSFCYSLTCNGLGALSCPFKIALKMAALQNLYLEGWSQHLWILSGLEKVNFNSQILERGYWTIPDHIPVPVLPAWG